MARREDEAEEIVPNALVSRRVEIEAFLIPLEIASDCFVLALEGLTAADQVDGAVLRGPHQPGSRPLRHAFGGPLLESGNKGVLCELFSHSNVADDASQPG